MTRIDDCRLRYYLNWPWIHVLTAVSDGLSGV